MGFFSRDTTVYVSSVIYPLGEELDKIPDVVKAAVITAGMKNSSRRKAIDKSIYDGQGIKMKQAYAYAKRNYYAGMPEGYPKLNVAKNDPAVEMLCEEYLAGVYGVGVADVLTVSVEFGNDYDTVLRQQIETEYNYDFYADEVHTAILGLPVGTTLELDVLAPDDILHPNDYGWRLTFTKPDTTVVTFDEWYPETLFAGTETRENRLIMEVSLSGAPAISLSYSIGDGDPRLNVFLRNVALPQSGTFPAICIKKPKQKYLDTNGFTGAVGTDAWKNTLEWKTSRLYATRLGLKLADIIALVKDNADEKQVDYAFIQPGTKINSPNTCAHEYHFNYFNQLRLALGDNKATYDAWIAANVTPGASVSKNKAKNAPAQSIRIVDPDAGKVTVDMEISWRYMTYEVKTGTIAKPYTIECGAQEFLSSRYDTGSAPKDIRYDTTKLYLRKRLTSNTYAELVVVGLWHENYIYKNKNVQSGVWEAFNDPDGDFGSGFLIPLEYSVYVSLSAREQLQLAQECLHMVFNCFKVVKQKWYATGWFKVILIIVAIVIIVLSWGTLTAYVGALYGAVYGAIGASLIAAGIAVTVVTAIVAAITAAILATIYVGVSFVAKEAGEYAAENWGAAWGAIVQMGVTIALTWGMGTALGSLSGVSAAVAPTSLAQSAVNAASFILSGLSSYSAFAMEEIQAKADSWNDYVTAPNNPLAEVNKLIEKYFPDMSEIQEAAVFAPRERMDDFLARTLGLTDTLTYRLFLPVEALSEMTLTTRLQ